jgi:two-component sensor histidine kinase
MKGGSLRKKLLIISGLLACIPALIVFLFLPPLGFKYKLLIEPVDKNYAGNVYVDLNSDSISEVLHSGKGHPYFHIIVQNNDLRVYDQWNFQDSLDIDMSDFFFGNYDNDKYKEIYSFTYKDDSLFLNINEFFDPHGMKLDRAYITKIRVVNKKITSSVWPAGFFDLNGDGKCEFYFSIQTGFGVEPRRLYSYDIVHNELKTSLLTGVICQRPKMVDSDGDGKPEIFGLMGASGNYKTWVPFTDRSSWLMVFDENLKFEFPPVEFPGLTNQLEIDAYKNGDFKGYVLSHNTGSADSTVMKPRIMLFSLDGKMIRERLLSDLGLNTFTWLVVLNYRNTDRIYLMGKELIEVDNKLAGINKTKSPFSSYYYCYRKDINFDGDEELLLFSDAEQKIAIYNSSLQKLVEAKIKGTSSVLKFSHFYSKDHEQKLFMQSGENGYFLQLKRNNYYYPGYSIYPGIYLLFFFFILIIMRIGTHQVEKRESLKQRLITLQLQGIKAQLDPHFTFNTLNSIASLIYLEDRVMAYDYMNKFTQLLRAMLNDAERIYRSLGEELDFVTTYLELEKLRFGDKFNYEIEVGEGISQKEQVPKMVLQTFAENAINHGIIPCAYAGMLKIMADRENDYLKLTIEDNGIGRASAAGHSTSTGKGLKLTGEFYDILNQINKKPVKHIITDLHNADGNAAGTRVEVWVPLEAEKDKRQK